MQNAGQLRFSWRVKMMNSTDKNLTLVGPLQTRMPAMPNQRFEARCHRCPWSYHKWTAEECRELLLWHLEDAHIDPSYLKEHEFFRIPLMTS